MKAEQESISSLPDLCQALFEAIPLGVVYQRADGTITTANPAALQILGLSLDQLQGRTSYDPRWRAIHEDGSEFPGEDHPSMQALHTGLEIRDVVMGIFNPATDTYSWINISAYPQFETKTAKPNFVITVFENITDRKFAESAKEEMSLLYKALVEQASEAFFVHDFDGKFVEVNKQACESLGYTREELLQMSVTDLERDFDLKSAQVEWSKIEPGQPFTLYGHQQRKNGSIFPVEVRFGVSIWKGQKLFLGLVRDITERKNAEKLILQLKRLYATLSQVNQTIVRVKDRNELFQSICDVAVEFGEFSLAWVGLLDEASGEIKPMAANGLDITQWPFQIVNIKKGDSKDGLVATAMRKSNVMTSENITVDERTRYQHEQFSKYNYHSSAVVPFCLKGKTIGMLSLSSLEAGLFKAEEEVGLLEEMGLDISFALETMATEAERAQAEAELRESEQLFSKVFADSPVAISMVAAENGKNIEVNQAWCNLTGYKRDELIGKNSAELGIISHAQHADTNQWFDEDGALAKNGMSIVTKSGEERIVLVNTTPLEINGQPFAFNSMQDVTELNKADQELKRWADIFQNVAFGFVIGNPQDKNLGLMNPAFARMHGYTMEELMGTPIADVFAPEDRAELPQHIHLILEKGHHSWEARHLRKDGTIFPVVVDAVAVKDDSGKVVYRIVSVQDITERRQAEEKQAQTNKLLTDLASLVPGVIYQYRLYPDGSSAFPYSSPGMYSIYEVTPEQVREDATPVFGRLHPDDADRVSNLIFESARTLKEFYCEFRVILPEQGLRWRWSQAHPERTEDGGTLWYGIISDISERKQAEEALKKSESEFRLLAEAMPQIVWTTRADGWNTYFNQQWVDYTGLTLEESYGHGWNKPFHPDDQQAAWDAWQNAVINKGTYSIECRLQRVDGVYKWWLIRGVPVLDADGNILKWFGTCTNIDKLKQTEQEVKEFNEVLEQKVIDRTTQLESANKELESFSYSVSHDLRGPLRALSGYTNILMEDYAGTLGAEGKRVCDVIISESQRMGMLIDNLLSFSRLGRTELHISMIDMQELVERIFDELTTPESRVRIDFRSEGLLPAKGDVALLRQVWVNLLTNALKFSSEKDKSIIEVKSSKSNNEIIYSVRDNGAGFDMQYAAKLFGVFQRLHSESEFEGTGVGLAIVQRVVSRHGGRVWAEGKVDEGAVFYFALPVKEEQIGESRIN